MRRNVGGGGEDSTLNSEHDTIVRCNSGNCNLDYCFVMHNWKTEMGLERMHVVMFEWMAKPILSSVRRKVYVCSHAAMPYYVCQCAKVAVAAFIDTSRMLTSIERHLR